MDKTNLMAVAAARLTAGAADVRAQARGDTLCNTHSHSLSLSPPTSNVLSEESS